MAHGKLTTGFLFMCYQKTLQESQSITGLIHWQRTAGVSISLEFVLTHQKLSHTDAPNKHGGTG